MGGGQSSSTALHITTALIDVMAQILNIRHIREARDALTARVSTKLRRLKGKRLQYTESSATDYIVDPIITESTSCRHFFLLSDR